MIETFNSQLKFHIYCILESWSNHRYTDPKGVSECEREKGKYAKHIGRDQNRNRGITKEEGKERGKRGREREIKTERRSERESKREIS